MDGINATSKTKDMAMVITDDNKPDSLGDALPKEISRVQEMYAEYMSIPAGFIAASLMKIDLDFAVKASTSGDLIAMIQAYEKLKEYQY